MLILLVKSFFTTSQSYLNNNVVTSTKKTQVSNFNYSETSNFSYNTLFLRDLYTLKLRLDLVSDSSRINNFMLNLNTKNHGNTPTTFNNKILLSILSAKSTKTVKSPMLLNTNFTISNIPSTRLHDLNYFILSPMGIESINKLGLVGNNLVNLDNSLAIAKQNRWLLKNTPTTRNLSTNNFLITEGKKLINYPETSGGFSGLNI